MTIATSEAGWRARILDSDTLIRAAALVLPLALLFVGFLLPLATILVRSLFLADGAIGLGNYAAVLGSAHFWQATWHTVAIAGATMAVTVTLGFLVAFALERTAMRGRMVIAAALALPLIAPSLVQALGLIFLLGRNGIVSKLIGVEIQIYGFSGLLIANALYILPQTVLILRASLRNADARLFEAAEIMGASGWRQFRDITLPGCRFGLLSAGFVAFAQSTTDFGNAATIGGDYSVLATEIYNQVVGQMNFNLGAVFGVILLVPTLISTVITRRTAGGTAQLAMPYAPEPERLRDGIVGACAWVIAALPVIVVGTVIYASFIQLWPYRLNFTLKHYNVTIAGGYAPLWTTIEISALVATIGLVLALLLGVALRKAPAWAARIVNFLAIMPTAIPGLVLGLGYSLAFNQIEFLYGSIALIVLCNFYHYHGQAHLVMATALQQVPAAPEEAALSLGGGFLSGLRYIVVPFISPTLIATAEYLFVQSMVTLSAVIFLVSPSVSVAAVSIMRLDEAGLTSQAAAYSTCTMAIVATVMLLARVPGWLGAKV